MKYTLVRLKFTEPLHISSPRDDYSKSETAINSDTMVAAIMQIASTIGETEIISSNPNFCISSLFPFYYLNDKDNSINNKYYYFFPKPIGSLLPRNYKESKEVKKIKYIEKTLFEKLLQGEEILDLGRNDTYFYLNNDESKSISILSKQVFIRNRVPRNNNENGEKIETKVYYTERIFFKENSGLFFLMTTENNEIKNKILKVLKVLETEGLGTDRNIGNGRFISDYEEVDWFKNSENAETKHVLNLSMFLPESKIILDEMLSDNPRYELKNRGGWITNYPYITLRKRNIKMFAESSVFRKPETLIYNGFGYTEDLTPDINLLPNDYKNIHPIFRSGKALFVNYQL